MALGELYQPTGLALETAKVVLEVEDPWACNVALGCTNGCPTCYGPKAFFKKDWTKVKVPKEPPVELVCRQLKKGLKPQGVFMSFGTDPFLPMNLMNTYVLGDFLNKNFVKVAVLSKIGMILEGKPYRHGMSIVSNSLDHWKVEEPRASKPHTRILVLEAQHAAGQFTWVSMEPYPPPAVFKQNILEVLESIKFVDFIIFGMLNYDKRATTPDAREAYKANIHDFEDFCKSNDIRHHVKSDTMAFIREE